MKKTIGIYIHIPFCVKKCLYCDFSSFPLNETRGKDAYIQALFREMEQHKDLLKEYEADTVFIGGGTPSLLSGEEMQGILGKLKEVICVSDHAEISMEMNPGTTKCQWLLDYKKAGINRVSVGLQSANEEELRLLGRIHSYSEFVETFRLLRECGYTNINVDIMSGLPYQKMETYEDTLNKVVQLNPEHISAYSLIVEEETPFYQRFGEKEGQKALPDEELDRRMYAFTKELLQQNGYERYEISNYAKPGYECRHNLKYWRLEEYLGLGLAAASYVDKKRYLNVGTLEDYEKDSTRMKRREITVVSGNDEMEEFMFLGLRTMKGVSKREFFRRFGVTMEEIYAPVIEKYEKMQMLENGDYLRLSEAGINVSNYLLSDFIL